MHKELKDIWPIYSIENDLILTRRGAVTAAFQLSLPEQFGLSDADYENMHQGWTKAIRLLPPNMLLHKQDWFIESKYQPTPDVHDSFLQGASNRFFTGRKHFVHRSFLFLTQTGPATAEIRPAGSSLLRRHLMPSHALTRAEPDQFAGLTDQFSQILSAGGLVQLRRMTGEELQSDDQRAGLLEQYCFLLKESELMIKDLDFTRGLSIGSTKCQLFSLADPSLLPGLCGPRVNYDRYSTDKTKFSIGFSSPLGTLLPVNHLYTQVLMVGDSAKTLKNMESRKRRLQSLSSYSRGNATTMEAVNEFLNEAVGNQRMPIKAHFHLLCWPCPGQSDADLNSLVSTALTQMDAVPKQELSGSPQLYWAGLPGNAGELPATEYFDTFAEQSACFFTSESPQRGSVTGIRFGDRLHGVPLFVDLFDEPMRQGFTSNRNMFVCGGSGGGKSMTMNHIVRSLFDTGAHIVVVDIGGSYKGTCELVGGYYFTYTEERPIRFNPFYLPPEQSLDTEKKESLKALLVSLWKQENESFNRSEYVALSNALQGYYDQSRTTDAAPSFNDFYDYLSGPYVTLLASHRVKESKFDLDNFLYVLRPFYQGGEFDYLLNATENLNLLDQPFIVFELDNIKDHPILFPVVTLVIMELFLSKMRKLKGVRKMLVIEEAWKAIAKNGMAEFVKYCFKTVRKFNGIAAVVTQEIDDLISSPVIKEAIINNADIKILMDMRKFMNKFDGIRATLGLSEQAAVQLLSVNRANELGRNYREVFIDLGGQKQMVVRNELSPEEYFAYSTEETEKLKVQAYASRYGSLQKGIAALCSEIQTNR